ncbi:MAG: chromate efflux transporter [Anaerolineae bacterium]|nr:chromate efflux transporter [Anaerolineae bacterium]
MAKKDVAITPLLEVATLFLRLGFTAFGGPAAHISLFHDEIVRRRGWLTEEQYLDLLGATNLIPGPNSTEMAIHLGKQRAGWPGFFAAGIGFIAPAMLIVMALAWAYVRFGQLPVAQSLLLAIQPVVIVIILQALILLGKKGMKDKVTGVISVATFSLALLGVNELALLFGGGVVGLVIYLGLRRRQGALPALLPLGALGIAPLPALATVPFSMSTLFLTFLKIGAILYGSGYVLIAFLRADFVERLGWITETQLIDAVAVGQITPGPLFTTATFIGYILGGPVAAVVATVGIFLPAFIFVAISSPLIPRLRASPLTAAFLDSVIAASLGLMAAVTVQLAIGSFRSILAVAIGLVSALLLFRFKVSSMWLVGGAAVVGIIAGLIS